MNTKPAKNSKYVQVESRQGVKTPLNVVSLIKNVFGYDKAGRKWWLFTHCAYCGYDTSLGKIPKRLIDPLEVTA